LQRKKSRNSVNDNTVRKTNPAQVLQSSVPLSNINIKNNSTIQSGIVNNVGVKLICDTPNNEIKKYFSKTKLYTNEDITLDYFSKYICFKQNYQHQEKDKISFFIYNSEEKVSIIIKLV
jgi:hypothetical protein